jgi:hypothetical protein
VNETIFSPLLTLLFLFSSLFFQLPKSVSFALCMEKFTTAALLECNMWWRIRDVTKWPQQWLVATTATRFVSPSGCKTLATPTACYDPLLFWVARAGGGYRGHVRRNLCSRSNTEYINPLHVRQHLNYIFKFGSYVKENGSTLGIATGYGLNDRGVRVRVLVWTRLFSSSRRPHRLWGRPISYPTGTEGSFSGSITAGSWSSPLASIWCRSQENVDL